MNQDLLTTFTEILVEDFDIPAEEIAPEATFEALGLDSLDVVDLTLAVEERVGIKLEDEELEDVRTVGDAVNAADAKNVERQSEPAGSEA
ncbi:MAG: acyl carrier protein [Acidimicrobiales bacterium]|nr:acyl carrier protein [Acidimicrobiales bacterium]